jgi:hypothetical protein
MESFTRQQMSGNNIHKFFFESLKTLAKKKNFFPKKKTLKNQNSMTTFTSKRVLPRIVVDFSKLQKMPEAVPNPVNFQNLVADTTREKGNYCWKTT